MAGWKPQKSLYASREPAIVGRWLRWLLGGDKGGRGCGGVVVL